MATVKRIEQILIRKGSKYKQLYKFLDKLSFMSKNLYNNITYCMRQDLIDNKFDYSKIPSFFDKNAEYCALPAGKDVLSQSVAEQIVKIVMESWTSFKKISIEFEKDPEKYCLKRGLDKELATKLRKDGTPVCKPSMPKYLDKEKGRYIVAFRGRNFKICEDGYLECTVKRINSICKEITGEESLKFKSYKVQQYYKENAQLKQVRIVPRADAYVIEAVLDIKIPDEYVFEENKYKKKEEREKEAKEDNVPNRVVSIKTGYSYFATVVNNFGEKPFSLLSESFIDMILKYSKDKARLQEIAKELNGVESTRRIRRLSFKFTRRTKYISNCYSKYIVDWCVANKVEVVILGKSKGMKQGMSGGNSNINGLLPIAIFENQLKYKFETAGIKVIEVSTAYTSRTSFLDLDPVVKTTKSKVKDGKVVSRDGTELSTHINSAYQLMRKRYNKVFNEDNIKDARLDLEYLKVVQGDNVNIVRKEIKDLKISEEALNANYVNEIVENNK